MNVNKDRDVSYSNKIDKLRIKDKKKNKRITVTILVMDSMVIITIILTTLTPKATLVISKMIKKKALTNYNSHD